MKFYSPKINNALLMKMKINKNEINNNLEKRNKFNISESKIKINKEENIKEFIGNNSKKILHNTLHDFIKDENYTTLKMNGL